jgi:hypothetical protein
MILAYAYIFIATWHASKFLLVLNVNSKEKDNRNMYLKCDLICI